MRDPQEHLHWGERKGRHLAKVTGGTDGKPGTTCLGKQRREVLQVEEMLLNPECCTVPQ